MQTINLTAVCNPSSVTQTLTTVLTLSALLEYIWLSFDYNVIALALIYINVKGLIFEANTKIYKGYRPQ